MASSALLVRLQTSLAVRPEMSRASLLVAAVASTALGHGTTWMPVIYAHVTSSLPPASSARSAMPAMPSEDTNERRLLLRALKEAILKAVILIGVPRCIEAILALCEAAEAADRPREEHQGYRSTYRLDEANTRRGEAGLERVYKDNLDAIFSRFEAAGAPELAWISQEVTYGLLLAPCSDTEDGEPRCALTFAETEIVVLSCLIAQRSVMTTRWHLRGALRSGLSREEIELVQQAIEEVGRACGVADLAEGMPRVADIADEEI